jgi:phospho-N-acetylmuramoyl-pentapeptide-transferase
MGGLMILSGLVVTTLLWANLASPYVWVVLFVTLGFGAIGFYDDYLKVTKQSHKGFSGRAARPRGADRRHCACIALAYIGTGSLLDLADLSLLQGRADQSRLVLRAVRRLRHRRRRQCGQPHRRPRRPRHRAGDDRGGEFGLIAYLVRQRDLRRLPADPLRAGHRRTRRVCGAVIGAGLGFLWFNAPPAAIFMGDTGSLALGGLLGAVAVATKHEIVLAIVGGLFVLEALSVIIQVASFKLTGKRVFRMAPIHHHFEKLGWTEPQVVIRFWIIAVLLA